MDLLYKIGTFGTPKEKVKPEEKLFSNIVGYADIKKLLFKSVFSNDPVNVLLSGPPSCSKTAFLLDLLEGLKKVHFVDGAGVSGAGMINHLFNSDTKYLLIDEIDKIKKNDQAALLNVMETGILSETKLKGKTRNKRMNLWVFATSNDIQRLSNPLKSRFIELHLHEYSFEEFLEITRRLLKKRYGIDRHCSEAIAYSVWNRMDVINIGKLTKSFDDIDWLISIHLKYGARKVL